MKELDCVDQLSASTLQKPQTGIMFSFIQKVHVYFYTEVLRSILDLSTSWSDVRSVSPALDQDFSVGQQKKTGLLILVYWYSNKLICDGFV